jgi:hypothetical protein
MFQIILEDRKKTDGLVSGGSFKKLVDSFRFPTDRVRNINAVGAVWNLGRLLNMRSSLGIRVGKEPIVLIYSAGPDMLLEKLNIASLLWDAGIVADIIREDIVTGEYINQIVRIRGISATIYLKDHSSRGQFGVVRLKSIERRQEFELTRSEIVETLYSIFAEGDREVSRDEQGMVPQPSSTPLNVSLFAPYAKIKGGQKTVIMEKAVRAMSPLLATMSGTAPIEVIAHDMSRDLLRRVMDTLSEGDDSFKKLVDSRDDRNAATKMRTLLRGLREKSFAFLYHYKENCIDLAPLTIQ